MKENKVQRNYKDTVFRMLFKEKENLLTLYNALNQTAYTDADGLEITTLENAVYMNYKNDISFVFDFELMLYEHQSSVNPNMPLRDLIYVTKVLQGRIKGENLYGTALVRIPTVKRICAVCRTGQDICKRHVLFGCGGDCGGVLYSEWDFRRVPDKEPCGGDSYEYI